MDEISKWGGKREGAGRKKDEARTEPKMQQSSSAKLRWLVESQPVTLVDCWMKVRDNQQHFISSWERGNKSEKKKKKKPKKKKKKKEKKISMRQHRSVFPHPVLRAPWTAHIFPLFLFCGPEDWVGNY